LLIVWGGWYNVSSVNLMDSYMKPTTKKTVPALERGIDVVELLASSDRPLSFSEILARLRIPRASLVRILDTLLYRGLIDKMEANGHYRVGIKLLYIGHRLKDKISLRSVAWSLMQRLSEQTGETVELAVLDNGQLLLIEQIEGSGEVRISSRIGGAYPYLHAVSVGKLYLAHMDPTKRKRVLDQIGLPAATPWTITDREVLERELGEILARGYAVEDQELRTGVRRVAAAVYDHSGHVAGGLSVAAPVFRLAATDFDKYGQMVKSVAAEISRGIGGRAPEMNAPNDPPQSRMNE